MSTLVCNTLEAGTLKNSSGTEVYTCKAWVNFNGTGTVAIRASGNVSSITDNGVGYYTVNLTTAMQDTNTAAITGGVERSLAAQWTIVSIGAGSFQVKAYDGGNALADYPMSLAVFR